MRAIWTLCFCATATVALATSEVYELDEAANASPEAAEPTETPVAPAEPETAQPGSVVRAQFTTAVEAREPVDEISALDTNTSRVAFFTELEGMAGRTITHRWEHNGAVMAEVPFEIGADRWRTHSTKALLPGWVGEWTVSVVDEDNHELARSKMLYTAAAPSAETPPVSDGQTNPAAPAPESP